MHRRTFLHQSALGAAGALAAPLWTGAARAGTLPAIDTLPGANDPALKALTDAALGAATAAGATYVDVRLTKTRVLTVGVSGRDVSTPSDAESVAAGIRVLVGDTWGFMSGASWRMDELVALARAAVEQARANHWATAKPVGLGERPSVLTGTWTTPITQDPFAVAVEDQVGLILAAHDTVMGKPELSFIYTSFQWSRQEKTFASSDGAFLTQTLYLSLGGPSTAVVNVTSGRNYGSARLDAIQATGAGYELLGELDMEQAYPRLYEEAMQSVASVEGELGRYEIVMDGASMATLVDDTVGGALQLGRAMGLEANAAGTSYLAPPESMLGTMKLAPSFVTIMANRSQPRGAATVKWDDEGMTPEEYALIKDGVVSNYETTRSEAPVLSAWDARQHRAVRSHGNAGAPDAFYETAQHIPNLVLAPAAGNATFESLVSQVEKGIAMVGARWVFDQQLLNGMGFGTMREIVNGTLGRRLANVALAPRAIDFWKNCAAIGGAASAVVTGLSGSTGEPAQRTSHSVTAVPARFTQVPVMNYGRRRA